MFNRKIMLIIIVAITLISIATVNADENTQNFTADSNNTTIASSTNTDAKLDFDITSVILTPTKLSTTYQSGKYFKVKATDSKTKKPAANIKLSLKVFTGNKHKDISVKTDSKGIAKYSTSKLGIGKHKIIVSVKDKKITSKAKTSYVKISKAKLTISAPKITSHYNVNDKFKVTVKNKETKHAMKGIKVMIKVFTADKYKKFSLKTNKNGAVSINTKNLKKGLHKVTVNVKESSKVKKASFKSTIKTIDPTKYMKIKVNGKVLNVKLDNNKATKTLMDKLKKGDIKIKAKEYGGFEKVGNLGFSLPTSDKYIKTTPGDLMLYQGNQISLFYNSNSWDYTKLGKVQNINAKDLKEILGTGNVELVLSLK